MANYSSENRKIVLLGYMGSGKTTVGKSLAEHLELPFIDLDDYIEQEAGMSIPEIFRDKGEIRFRKLESSALRSLIGKQSGFVLALGGGTPCYAGNLEVIESDETAISVYLKCSLANLVDRLWPERGHRPLISHLEDRSELDDFIRKHLFERTYYYNRADKIIDCDALNVHEIVEKINLSLTE